MQRELSASGQLSGDISELLRKLSGELGAATVINVNCPRLIRLDFMAAGDLLNWVLSRRSENRSVSFSEPHRLVAMFFAAMGINEHAKIKVRTAATIGPRSWSDSTGSRASTSVVDAAIRA